MRREPRHFAGLPAAVSAAALLLLSGQAWAQQEITAEDAEAYFRTVQSEATEIMDTQAFDRLTEWTEANIADGAVLQASISMVHDGHPKGFATFTMDKEDLLRFGGVFVAGAPHPGIEDYALELDVGEVIPHGDAAATVKVTWTERFTVSPPEGAGMGAGAGTGTESGTDAVSGEGAATDGAAADAATDAQGAAAGTEGSMTVEATADCVHLLVREGEGFAIGLSTCTGELRH